MNAPLGWTQLRHRPLRLLVALAGIGFAVLLIMMQLGFRAALFDSAVRIHERLEYDIALFSPDSVFIVRPQTFSIRRLYQALGDVEVADVTPVHIFPAVYKNPWTGQRRSINTLGFDTNGAWLNTPGIDAVQPLLTRQDAVAIDLSSRPEFAPPDRTLAEALAESGTLTTEVNDREIDIVGGFRMGTSFGIDGSLVTSVENWLRLFPDRGREDIQLGLLKLAPGADADVTRDRLREALPKDVLVMTRADFIARETAYWNSATPIGYIFAFGAIMGLLVGAIIVYQILFADVSEHLPEYGTLRAIGYSSSFVSGIVLQQAGILAVLGFVPGIAAAAWLYGKAAAATSLPLVVTPERAGLVFAMTLGMCAFSAWLAVRRVRRLDPADVF
ncbi:FtsX-like permease family protein [Marinihelvus fidelis]|uniref:FtsX-like permease family protein n=1 Tax=Marinihelvus fidelis TaxID=2613842 RepID=A0A5N0TCE8_9GAMM|nr:ABC transporter permease DevC [Marinihelvus fidelis]KAA9132685.1 FtsX-like permease family protein [Marinihelvus fidelis]